MPARQHGQTQRRGRAVTQSVLALLLATIGLGAVGAAALPASVASASTPQSSITIPVGTTPTGIAVDPVTNTIYVANTNSSTVSVISEATDAVTATIDVSTGPESIAVDPTTDTIYVASGSSSVSVIDGATNTVTASITVGQDIVGLADDPATDTLYVLSSPGSPYDSTTNAVNGATNTVEAMSWSEQSAAMSIAVDPATDMVYVADSPDATAYAINGATGTSTMLPSPFTSAIYIAVDPTTDTIYGTAGPNLYVLDAATNATQTVPISNNSSSVAVDPTTDTIYSATAGSGTVLAINGETDAKTAIGVAVSTSEDSIAVDPTTGVVAVTNMSDNSVSILAPPAIVSSSTTTFTPGASGTFTFDTTGSPAPTITESGALPSGVTFTSNTNGTATLSGTPAAGAGGTYDLTVTASNGIGADATQDFSLVVPVPPTITTTATSTAFTDGTSGSYTFTASGSPAPTFSESGSLPSGVTLSSTGVLSGTPTQAGVFPITVTAANGESPDATLTFTLDVDGPPVISEPQSSETGQAGQAINPVDFTATGYPAPAFSESGPLPSGVTLSSSGVLSGTPTVGGPYPITVTATNASGSEPIAFTLTIDASPSITSAASTTFTVGMAGSFAISTSGYPAPTLSLSSSSTLPSGLSFTPGSAGTATISGTPATGTGGSHDVGIDATSASGSAAQVLTVVVDAKPAFTSQSTIGLDAGSTVSFAITTSGGYPTPALSATGLPTGLVFTDNGNGTASLAGTVSASDVGSYSPVVTAQNSSGTVTQDIALTIQAPGSTVSNCPTGDICSTGGATPKAPAITSAASTTFLEGTAGSYQVVASGTPTPTFTIASGQLPSGVTLSSTGVLSGTPEVAGTFDITVKAANGVSPDATQPFVLTVTAPPPPGGGGGGTPPPGGGGGGGGTPPPSGVTPTTVSQPAQMVSPKGSATFSEGTGGSYQVQAFGTPTPSFTVTAGSLPPGITLSSSGLLSGTPTTAGSWTVTVAASNGVGQGSTETLTITVEKPQVQVLTPSGPDYRFVGRLYGALSLETTSPVSLAGVHESTRGSTLEGLDATFGFAAKGGIARLRLVLDRDTHVVTTTKVVHGRRVVSRRRVAYYAGVLGLVDPKRAGELVFRSFVGVSMHGTTVTGIAVGKLKLAKRVKVAVKVHGHSHLVWRIRHVEAPIRFGFKVTPSVS